jgi:ssDNA-binding Zn-finger/Zn-ribbon topoisomerase 1
MDFVVLIVLIVVALGAGSAFTWQQTKTQGRFGIGKLKAKCPRCGTQLPMIRKPASREEKLWGGWTCPKCGCQVDRYGKERAAA